MNPERATELLNFIDHPYTRPTGNVKTLEGRRGPLGTKVFNYQELPGYTQTALEYFGIPFDYCQFGSSTISSFQLDAQTAPSRILRRFLSRLDSLSDSHKEEYLKRQYSLARRRIGRLIKIGPDEAERRIFFGHSGTHLIQMLRMGMPEAEVVLLGESGTTMKDAYEGRHLGKSDLRRNEQIPKSRIVRQDFGKVHEVSLRTGVGGYGESFSYIQGVVIQKIREVESGQVIVHIPLPSKTAYSQSKMIEFAKLLKNRDRLVRLTGLTNPPDVIVVLDMAQTRTMWDKYFRDPVGLGFCDIALWTGSKSLAGNGFSGIASVSDGVVSRLHRQKDNPRYKWCFHSFAKRYVRGGYLPEEIATRLLDDIPKYDGGLLGRMISVLPTLKRVEKMDSRKYHRNTLEMYLHWNEQISDLKRLFSEFAYSDRSEGHSSVLPFELGGVHMKKLRALLMHSFNPARISEIFNDISWDLANALAVPLEISNPVSEKTTRPTLVESIANAGQNKYPDSHLGLGRIAFTTDMILDWSDPIKQDQIKKAMYLLGLKMAWISKNYIVLSSMVHVDPNNDLFFVSD